jgi:hypothetical protein
MTNKHTMLVATTCIAFFVIGGAVLVSFYSSSLRRTNPKQVSSLVPTSNTNHPEARERAMAQEISADSEAGILYLLADHERTRKSHGFARCPWTCLCPADLHKPPRTLLSAPSLDG